MKKGTASIENITPPSERDLGGVTVYLVEVTFRLDPLDEHDAESSKATQVCLDELDEFWGASREAGRDWQPDWSKSVYPVENGVFVATLPVDPAWKVGKRFAVMFPNASE